MDKNNLPLQDTNDYGNRSRNHNPVVFFPKGRPDTNSGPMNGITIKAKLKQVGNILTDAAVGCTTKLVGKISAILTVPQPPRSENAQSMEDCWCEYENYSDETENEMVLNYTDEERLDDVEDTISRIEDIIAGINSDLDPCGDELTCKHSGNEACTGINCRHKIVVDEFHSPPDGIGTNTPRFIRPVPIIATVLNSIRPVQRVSSDTSNVVDKETNLRAKILKWD